MLRDLGCLLVARDLDQALGGRQPGLRHGHLGIGLRDGTALAILGDDFRELAHADRIEHVVLVQLRERCLVELDQRDSLQLQSGFRKLRGHGLTHGRRELSAPAMQIVKHEHGRVTLHNVDEAALENSTQIVRAQRACTEGLHCGRHTTGIWRDAHTELHDRVDAQAVLGKKTASGLALHHDALSTHAHFVHAVQDGQCEEASVERHPLAAGAGAKQRHVASRFPIKTLQEGDGNDHDDRRENYPCNQCHTRSRSGPVSAPINFQGNEYYFPWKLTKYGETRSLSSDARSAPLGEQPRTAVQKL
ncbi:MAG: hypothetical protein ABIP61_11420 [Burkholderiaceae bacterium]